MMPEMSETELRTLFQVAGHERAPDALHAAVMERVLAQASGAKPLIAPWQWLLAALVLVMATASAWAASLYAHGAPSPEFPLPFHVDLSRVGHLLHHASWIALTMGAAFVLTLMDHVLARTHAWPAH
jgi:hypothetical protein